MALTLTMDGSFSDNISKLYLNQNLVIMEGIHVLACELFPDINQSLWCKCACMMQDSIVYGVNVYV